MFGAVCGAAVVATAAGETLTYPKITYYVVVLGVLIIYGLFELVFAVRRHQQLVRDLDLARSKNA